MSEPLYVPSLSDLCVEPLVKTKSKSSTSKRGPLSLVLPLTKKQKQKQRGALKRMQERSRVNEHLIWPEKQERDDKGHWIPKHD